MKSPVWSKTYWFAALTFVVSLCGFLEGQEFIRDYPAAIALIGVVWSLASFALRSVTHERIGTPRR